MMAIGEEFFTLGSLGTMAVASGAILAVTNTIRRVFGIGHLVVPLIVALVITFSVAAAAHKLGNWPEWIVAFLNACLLFCTATGAQELVTADQLKPKVAGAPELQRRRSLRWWSSWTK